INIPENFQLAQNYPNPFNPSTKIEFSIPVTAHVTISIFNVLGQETTTIVDEIKPAGNYTITWNGTDSYGQKVSSGLYFYRINANDYTESKKMALVQ
ncbi:MAG: T9SS type A sorting domain-containing protein, partial [candidate division Zixibacteria bacterium]|nr:T9SS type A sorting domain-containing protein [candidate division Zixibacteria bacterium]